jgi:penicillin-binding protein 2
MRAPLRGTLSERGIGRRAFMLLGLQMGMAGTLAWRMRQLQVEQSAEFRLLAEENRVNLRLLPPARGLVHDRNGVIIAENRQNYRVSIIREETDDPEASLRRLAALIRMDPAVIPRALDDMKAVSAFVPVTLAEHLSWEDYALIALNAPALPGIATDVGLSRYYPKGENFAHVLGYVGPVSEADLEGLVDPDPVLQIPKFQIGKNGIEKIEEDSLRGQAGASRIEVNAAGRVMRELERDEGTPGTDLQLTLDNRLQDFALRRMAGESAATVVIDVESGDIHAMASAPSFDPNAFVFGISVPEWNGLLNDDHKPLSNKSVSGAYPPGSTYKPVVALAALEAGVISPTETVFCPGHYTLGNRRFHCWSRGGHGRVNMHEALKFSCDVYFYEVAKRTGVDTIAAMAAEFGFGTRLDLPIPAIAEGLSPTSEWKKRKYEESWQQGDTLNVGIGQGYVLATPLQLALMAARIASGRKVEPRVVRARAGIPVPVEPAPGLAVSPASLETVRGGLYAVSNEARGTGYRMRIAEPSMQMAGKTGTSQVRQITAEERARGVTRNADLPWERRDHGLFICWAPFDAPRFAAATIVEHGGGGSTAAAPIARDILLYALYGGMPPLTAYPEEQREDIRARLAAIPDPPEAEVRAGSRA